MEVIYETLNSDAATVKIGEGKIPSSAVKSTLLKLTPFDFEYAIKNFLEKNKSKVILPTYVLTILYRANMQKELEIQRNLHQDLGYVQPGIKE